MLSGIFRNSFPKFPRRCLSTFIEEEYFEDYGIPKEAPPPKEDVTKRFRRPESDDVDFVETIVGALGEQKARDVFVVKSDDKEMTPYSHRIVCSVFNSRQAAAISENLREILKMENEQLYGSSNVKSNTKRSNGWYVSEIERVQIHVMSEDCREKYDLEAVWSGDDRILEQIDELKNRILLPPKRL
ncbi:hypothetical protein L5515_005503 [Caenorhabditis briggsae]|uniref:Uncharacterized protein n=1 Tax=Caenorhabditis briggsae TaxID=6238 RepID=A0AAE9JE91_CAEBR|nr:hypothetical protein L5515_005503 [Caenorhabditis briggsae]